MIRVILGITKLRDYVRCVFGLVRNRDHHENEAEENQRVRCESHQTTKGRFKSWVVFVGQTYWVTKGIKPSEKSKNAFHHFSICNYLI